MKSQKPGDACVCQAEHPANAGDDGDDGDDDDDDDDDDGDGDDKQGGCSLLIRGIV